MFPRERSTILLPQSSNAFHARRRAIDEPETIRITIASYPSGGRRKTVRVAARSIDMHEDLARVHTALGRPPANLVWAKLELLLGLSAAGIGVALSSTSPLLSAPLFAFGSYLALAGHRSQLYEAMSRQTAVTWRELDRG